jgi:hypothetical protein
LRKYMPSLARIYDRVRHANIQKNANIVEGRIAGFQNIYEASQYLGSNSQRL